jgi:ribose transport system substrate-binding protein
MRVHQTRFLFLAALLLAALVVAGCGGGSSSSSGSSSVSEETSSGAGEEETSGGEEEAEAGGGEAIAEQAKEEVKKFSAVPEWEGPTEPTKPKPAQTIGVNACTLAAEGCVQITEGIEGAAEALGWKVITLSGEVTPQKELANVEQFVQQGVNAIIDVAIADSSVSTGIKAAESAGIPFVCAVCGNPPEDIGTPGFSAAEVDANYEEQGEAAGYFIIAEGGGNAALFNENLILPNKQRWEGLKKTLAKSESVNVVSDQSVVASGDINAADYKAAQAVLQQYPEGELQWMVPSADSEGIGQVQALQALGREEVKTISYDCGKQNLGFIREGKSQVACVGTPLVWLGWAGTDQVVRLINGEEPAEEDVGITLVTKENVPPAGQEPAYPDYPAEYEKLWGVK